jgi:hypothetical protein
VKQAAIRDTPQRRTGSPGEKADPKAYLELESQAKVSLVTSYEGDRSYRTDGGKYKHPIQEAEQAHTRLAVVAPQYDEFLILKYRACNEPPYPFEWVNEKETRLVYGAALIRISNEYQSRF